MFIEPEPDLKWYSGISTKKGITTRCPFASVFRCPRYYQSLSLMGHAGSTEIDTVQDHELKVRWEKTDLWPITAESAVALSGTPEKKSFTRFCPEVIYDRFGLFAENLCPYDDEFHRDRLLKLKGPAIRDWEYNWSNLKELHYSDCNMYALLKESQLRLDQALQVEEVLEVKPGAFGVNVNLKELLTRFCLWWLKRVKKTPNVKQ